MVFAEELGASEGYIKDHYSEFSQNYEEHINYYHAQISVPHVIATAGSYIDVTLSLDQNQGLTWISLFLYYDGTALEKISESVVSNGIFDGPVIQGLAGINRYVIGLGFCSTEVTYATGDLITISFKVLDEVAIGTVAPIWLAVEAASTVYHSVEVETIGGSVFIAETVMHPIHIIAPHTTALAGEYIDITLDLRHIPEFLGHEGLSILSLDIYFNDEVMQRVGNISQGNVFDGNIIQPPLGANPFRVNLGMANVLDVTYATGGLVTIPFRLHDDVTVGSSSHILARVVSAHRLEGFMLVPVNVTSGFGSVEVVEVVTHPITILGGGTGAYANPNPAEVGQQVVNFAGYAPPGHIFTGWTAVSPSDLVIEQAWDIYCAWFNMPDEPVVIRANWELPTTVWISTFQGVQHVRVGQYIDIPLYISQHFDHGQGVSAMGLMINHDSTELQRVGIMVPYYGVMALPVHPPVDANPFILNFNLPNPLGVTTESGTLAYIRFRVNGDVEPQRFSHIEITPLDAFRMEGFTPIPVGVGTTGGIIHIDNPILWGDVNDDGAVDSVDLMMLRLYLAGHPVPINRAAADVNADGVINMVDEIMLSMYLAGHPVVLGPQPSGLTSETSQQLSFTELTYTLGDLVALNDDLAFAPAFDDVIAEISEFGSLEAFNENTSLDNYIDIIINLDENEGVSALSLDLNYDATVLQRISITPSDIMQMPVHPPINAYPFTMNFNLLNPIEATFETGRFVTVRFRVLDAAALEATPITVSVNSAYRIENFAPVAVDITGLGVDMVVNP